MKAEPLLLRNLHPAEIEDDKRVIESLLRTLFCPPLYATKGDGTPLYLPHQVEAAYWIIQQIREHHENRKAD